MRDLLKALAERVVIGDGAMGTQILAKGVPVGPGWSELNLAMPELVRGIHREYVEAGAELVETNTLTANRLRVADRVREINLAGARIAREAAGEGVFVGGSIGPLTGIAPVSDQQKVDVFAEQAVALAEGGVDVLMLETFADAAELRLAVDAARGAAKLPVVALMAFVRAPADRTLAELAEAGADVVGVNCTAPDCALEVVERMRFLSKMPLAVFPSGAPPSEFAALVKRMVGAGAGLVGGCCGTGPEHIRAIVEKLR